MKSKLFYAYAGGKFLSDFGSIISKMALVLFFTFEQDSASQVAFVFSISAVVSVLTLPFGGILSDRVSRPLIMLVTDLLNAVIAFGTLMILWVWSTSGELHTLWLFTLLILQTVVVSFDVPASEAFVVNAVGKDNLVKAQSLVVMLKQIAQVAAQSVAGLFYAVFGPVILFALDTLTFLISGSTVLLFIKGSDLKLKAGKVSVSSVIESFFDDLRAAIQFIIKSPSISKSLIFSMILLFVFVPFFTLLPFYAKATFGKAFFGYCMCAMTLGTFAAGALTQFIAALQTKELKYKVGLLLFAKGIFMAGFFSPIGFFAMLIMMFFIGFTSTVASVALISHVKMNTPDTMVGKVMSCFIAGCNLLQPVSVLLVGTIMEQGLVSERPVGLALAGLIGLVGLVFFVSEKELSHELSTGTLGG